MKTLYVIIFAVLFVAMIVSIVYYMETGEWYYQLISLLLVLILFNGTGFLIEILKGENK